MNRQLRTVLIVDDNRDAASTLAKLLEHCGYLVVFELTASDALRVVPMIKPDVILIDLAMPVMTGYELAQRLNAQALDPKPKLVSLTGLARGKGQGDDSIFDDYLLKPVDLKTLRKVIEDGH